MTERKDRPMDKPDWIKEFPGAVTVCDETGVILKMNDRAVHVFERDGGAALIGKNILDCHPEPSLTKLKNIIAEKRVNVYTIEKDGVKKLIYQAPWFRNGKYKGFVELSLEIPFDTPHFVRKG